MRALVCSHYGSPDELRIEECGDPVPGPGELLVDVAAAGINFADILSVAGQYQVKTPPPFIAGNEAAGTVAALGDNVERFRVGDPVMIATRGGAFAEKCVASAASTIPLPDGLSLMEGAGFPVSYGTSYHALKQSAGLREGETVLVLGAAGGTGISAVQLAAARGARVIAAASSDEKLAFAQSAGAHATINYSRQPLRDTLRDIAADGVDVVYDPVGGELATQAFRAMAWQGRYLVIGFASGEIPQFAANIALLKEARIVGVWWGGWAARNPLLVAETLQELSGLIESGKLHPPLAETFALDDYAAAFATITQRRARGKVVLRMA